MGGMPYASNPSARSLSMYIIESICNSSTKVLILAELLYSGGGLSLYTRLGIVMNLMRRFELIFQELLLRLTNKITQVTIRPSTTTPQYPGQTFVLY